MTKLKPWYQVVTPREDLRDGRPLDASEFAVHLDHIRTGRENVSKDYTDPVRFFDRTFLTGEEIWEIWGQRPFRQVLASRVRMQAARCDPSGAGTPLRLCVFA